MSNVCYTKRVVAVMGKNVDFPMWMGIRVIWQSIVPMSILAIMIISFLRQPRVRGFGMGNFALMGKNVISFMMNLWGKRVIVRRNFAISGRRRVAVRMAGIVALFMEKTSHVDFALKLGSNTRLFLIPRKDLPLLLPMSHTVEQRMSLLVIRTRKGAYSKVKKSLMVSMLIGLTKYRLRTAHWMKLQSKVEFDLCHWACLLLRCTNFYWIEKTLSLNEF